MLPWLFNVHMREMNARVLGKRLEQLRANDGRFVINKLLFAHDKTIVADSDDREVGQTYEKKSLFK